MIALTHLSNDLSRDRMSHQVELAEKLELESREEALRVQMEAGERLMKTLEIDRRGRDDADVDRDDADGAGDLRGPAVQ